MNSSNIVSRSGFQIRSGDSRSSLRRFLSKKGLVISTGIAGLLAACATVRPVAAPAADPRLPEMRLFAAAGGAVEDRKDFKLRTAARDSIQLVLLNEVQSAELSAPLRDIAFLKMVNLLGFPDVKLITPPAEIAGELASAGPAGLKYLEELQADAVASVQVKEVGENQAKLALRLLDPVSGEAFGEYVQSARIVERAIDPAHQAEFFRDRKNRRIEFLEAGQSPQLEFSGDGKSSVRDLVLRSVTASLSVQSSSPETEVVLISGKKRKSLGSVPIGAQRLREGLHRLELKRPGYEMISREVQIRAGRDRDLFITWPDDQGATSLSILSAPSGQRVSLDGTVRGQTPLYITSIDPGAYALEVSRTMEGGAFEVVGEAAVEVAGGQNDGRVFFTRYDENFTKDLLNTDYWTLSADTEGVRPEYVGDGGLAFRVASGAAPGSGRLGLTSQPMAIESFDMTLLVRQAAGNALTFGLVNRKQESVLVRISGKVYTLERFNGEQPVAPLSFETIKQREGNLYPLRFRYDKAENRLQVEVDGDVIYEGPYNGGAAARIALWATADSADGRELARSLRIRSGRGLYDD